MKGSDFKIDSNFPPLGDQESVEWNEELELLFMQSFFTSSTFYKPTGKHLADPGDGCVLCF